MNTKKIGAFIAMNRKKKGYTQEQLAEKLGVTNKTISRWENGHYMPDLSLLEPLSKELDITLNELLAGEEIVKEEDLQFLSESALADACCPGNPRDTSVEDIEALYRSLLK